MVFFIVYVICVLPMSVINQRYGIRSVMLICSSVTTFGLILKFIALTPSLFWLSVIGQTLIAVSIIYLNSCPTQIASTWFAKNEANKAMAVLVFANFFALSVGFLATPLLVANLTTAVQIANTLRILILSEAIVSIILLFSILIFFDSEPKTPPSMEQQIASHERESLSFRSTIIALFKNPNYILLVISSGCIIGIFNALFSLLNQMISSKFAHSTSSIGVIGAMYTFSGCISSSFLGWIADKFPLKLMYALNNFLVFLSMLCFMVLFKFENLWPFYIVTTLVGFFLSSNFYLALKLAAKVTYPQSEAICSGILITFNQITAAIFTAIGSNLISAFSAFACVVAFCVIVLIAMVIDCFIKDIRSDENNTLLQQPESIS
ncbi:Feline leukemia virus subgroup C receptor-related protein 2-like protein [Dinothrombium tinctorium]|uniref:Feline leukemia virus subgroup C receptor-related protein 2-like protein n=1 Tax=Dinothrombium tinctorium TaxID=1965070 RepID=A0A3S3Q894_9ACAR|nr:Feline leukemia virus subgroup C receptor-related protein 2-like protein [Dinothrombium tinctorium]RWS05146.1 Feline leukemia virus subgroup C receptor-related protein 2-like protein [Dinothrombium tinctorium]RWS05552.1 Feline leukemia virus subgroup C receptor-related protein 2-like protein [Dinothrombium tinctorium]